MLAARKINCILNSNILINLYVPSLAALVIYLLMLCRGGSDHKFLFVENMIYAIQSEEQSFCGKIQMFCKIFNDKKFFPSKNGLYFNTFKILLILKDGSSENRAHTRTYNFGHYLICVIWPTTSARKQFRPTKNNNFVNSIFVINISLRAK